MKRNSVIYYSVVSLIYFVLLIVSLEWGYFWDVIQQIGNEGYYFYEHGFSNLVIPRVDGNLISTGYHIPGLAYLTALAWTVFGRAAWVSHVITFCFAGLLIFSAWSLVRRFVAEKWQLFAGLLIVLEPAVLTQFAICSPDFVMLCFFMAAVAAFFSQRAVLTGVFAMCIGLCNMRGVFAAAILLFAILVVQQYTHKLTLKYALKLLIPSILVFGAYYISFFIKNGWFFEGSMYSDHYHSSYDAFFMLKHGAAMALRLLEEGRFIVYIAAIFILIRFRKEVFSDSRLLTLFIFCVLTFALYFFFIFATQMPFLSRYFMMLFATTSLIVFTILPNHLSVRRSVLFFSVVAFAELTGHLWVYPEPVARVWDATLAHAPYYNIRQDVFSYLDSAGIERDKVRSGFTFVASPITADFKEGKSFCEKENSSECEYFLYSNICNFEDEDLDFIKNECEPLKSWHSGFVKATLYKMPASE